ncbi:hypothetical protein ABZ605_28285 [Streptomyces sp. NPDC012765]|uniref:hypothetical protein n=1 Tax=Streptomyces sp. NPDC012765 TaxID=3155249 RepID=UPI00340BD337
MPDQETATTDAPFGYGLSQYDGGIHVHVLAADWTITHHPGHPDSLWPEFQTARWYPTAPARCRRAAQWKAAAPAPGPAQPGVCPACRLTDAQRAQLDTRVHRALRSD